MGELISIVVPVYNGEKTIEECLASICRQAYNNLEIIVINDGSRDSTEAICEKYKAQDSRITIYRQDNAGLSAARNTGIRLARGEYICFIDADDYLENGYVSSLYNHMQQYQADLTICGFQEKNGNMVLSKTEGEIRVFTKEEAQMALLKVDLFRGYAWNKMYKKSIIDKFNLQYACDLHNWEDVYFNYLYMEHADKTVYDPTVYYNYMYWDFSLTHTVKLSDKTIERIWGPIDAQQRILKEKPSEPVRKQLEIRMVDSAIAVLRMLGMTRKTKQYHEYYSESLKIIRKGATLLSDEISRSQKMKIRCYSICPWLLNWLYAIRYRVAPIKM